MPQFYLGSTLTGAPVHHHGPAVNLLLNGKKLWLLSPPSHDSYALLHPLEYLEKKKKETNEICSYTQLEGEVMFVPRHYSHLVLNLKLSVGIAVEAVENL